MFPLRICPSSRTVSGFLTLKYPPQGSWTFFRDLYPANYTASIQAYRLKGEQRGDSEWRIRWICGKRLGEVLRDPHMLHTWAPRLPQCRNQLPVSEWVREGATAEYWAPPTLTPPPTKFTPGLRSCYDSLFGKIEARNPFLFKHLLVRYITFKHSGIWYVGLCLYSWLSPADVWGEPAPKELQRLLRLFSTARSPCLQEPGGLPNSLSQATFFSCLEIFPKPPGYLVDFF